MVLEQDREVVAFFDHYLKDGEDSAPHKTISYYTMGEGKWKTTTQWPLPGFMETVFYFHPDGSLDRTMPTQEIGSNQYAIDYSATTGEGNRWHTQMGGLPILYPDRATEDQKLLVFTSEPLENQVEISGNPIVSLNLSSTTTDAAVYVYLETIAPDGKVIYITEGQLRGLHRQETTRDLGRVILGTSHSYARAEGQEMVPGENVEMNLGMFATSVLIPQGYRLRVALAGHDASTFERIPNEGNPVIELQTNHTMPSFVILPMKIKY